MRLAVLALLLVAAGCDAPSDDPGSFSLALSGARTATLGGTASFFMSSCRSLSFYDGEAALHLNSLCDQDPNGASRDRLRRGTFAVSAERGADLYAASFYDTDSRRTYRGTGGTLEITAESRERIAGRIDVEARPVDGDDRIDMTAEPLHITGTFDAAGTIGLD